MAAICTLALLASLAPLTHPSATAAPASPASGCRPTVGLVRRSLVVGGITRSYLVAIPASVTRPAPVLLAFHGYSSSGATLAARSRLHEVAGTRAFVTVYPEGTGSPTRWALPRRLPGPDDAAFVDAVVADVARRGCGDPGAVHAAGFSNGAAFVGHLACRRPQAFRGLAFVGGAGLATPCASQRVASSVPVVIAHGADDRVVPTTGGPVLGGALQAEALRTTVERWRREGRRVSVRVVPGTGHVWPALVTEEIVATFAG